MYAAAVSTRRFLLMGSGEFEPWSEEVEAVALDGRDGYVAVLPTASALEGDHVFDRWATAAVRHYERSGIPARVVSLRTRADAGRPDVASEVGAASMFFFSGGNARYLAETIEATVTWDAMMQALDRGAVYAGCSAGAMVASQSRGQARARGVGASWIFGLGLVPHVSFGVHWDKVRLVPGLRPLLMSRIAKDSWFVGIDERTAILGDGMEWRVFGRGAAMVRHARGTRRYEAGHAFSTYPVEP